MHQPLLVFSVNARLSFLAMGELFGASLGSDHFYGPEG
ncbi:hypothetical protein MPNT_40084 [Candidatus Methylacidithermus pantelleriae]|uniref:Uncharacterized protein n=1 Tax=Candidatus Methylacidithermus pantelleriae TaxID=2744239 RepID=A0A8J2BUZ5_9BACT|nr:hypothetical protein MPNT_40084 [Candidatus Methylacidithermus pantelleriae]